MLKWIIWQHRIRWLIRTENMMPRNEIPLPKLGSNAVSDNPSAAPWIEQALQQLDAIAQLEAGWDSNGAQAPDPALVRAGGKLLRWLWCHVGNFSKPYSRPQISPTRSGGVQFEWEGKGCFFELEIVDERHAHWFFQDSGARLEEEGEFLDGENPSKMLAYIDRVVVP